MFEIKFTDEAKKSLRSLRAFDRERITEACEKQLTQQPDIPTKNRKSLRPNRLAGWELRIGQFRVFYDVLPDDQLVKVVQVGYKEGNQLFIQGEEYHL
jgi:mRNA-degrading endonuclease RelE of RelBE toxin-antitoxin system